MFEVLAKHQLLAPHKTAWEFMQEAGNKEPNMPFLREIHGIYWDKQTSSVPQESQEVANKHKHTWIWQRRTERNPGRLFVHQMRCHVCNRERNWHCCVRFGITADLPSVAKAATTDWTAKCNNREKPSCLLFNLIATINVFRFWKIKFPTVRALKYSDSALGTPFWTTCA